MKKKYFKKKWICVFLIFVMMLQSCTVYKKTPVSVKEAAAIKNKVLLTRTDGTKHKLKKIDQIDGEYFGIMKVHGQVVKVPITETTVKTIHVKNRTKSTLGTVGISVGSFLLVTAIIGAIKLQEDGLGPYNIPITAPGF